MNVFISKSVSQIIQNIYTHSFWLCCSSLFLPIGPNETCQFIELVLRTVFRTVSNQDVTDCNSSYKMEQSILSLTAGQSMLSPNPSST